MKKKSNSRFLIFFTFLLVSFLLYYTNMNINTLRNDINDLRTKTEIKLIHISNNLNKKIIESNKSQVNILETLISLLKVQIKAVNNLKALIPPKNVTKANYKIINTTQGWVGSGTLIKINNKKYLLSCAHLIGKVGDVFVAKNDNESDTHFITLVKYNKENDLALFKIYTTNNNYLEISDEEPKVGDKVFIVGNPDGYTDIVTSGIISKKYKKYYLSTALTYFGNSGGAMVYKGKLAGVVSAIVYTFTVKMEFFNNSTLYDKPFPYTIDLRFSMIVNLKTVKEFLNTL